ncbi:MAG: M48 family metallopeptidase [Phycisphaerales bacterium]|nr:M48 family metallopeptidase [Phycisphaerales bacterium]
MDFFAHQDHARRRTGRLVLYFAMAIVSIVIVLYIVAMILFNWSEVSASSNQGGAGNSVVVVEYWNWTIFLGILGLCTLIIGGGSLYRILHLASGGSVVAESLGGKLLDYEHAGPDERRLLNVIEEMAIASGVPVPPVYLIEDDTINAFAAGYRPTDAVIGVTRGCVEGLSRDQLQGVMAHEFSHIFNGDMRLNIRLVGVIHGLLVMGVIGYYVLRTAGLSSGGRSSSNNKGNGAAFFLIFGLAMMAVGFIGTFFGRLIQAAVSRQREFLADASAVQYTRNPDGIGGALRAIGGIKKKTSMPHTASEYNHMFFAQALDSVFASHPPLADRISRIEGVPVSEVGEAPASQASRIASAAGASGFAGEVSTSAVHAAVESIGVVNPESIKAVGHVISTLPDSIKAATHDPWGARLVILGLLLPPGGTDASRELTSLEASLDEQHLKMLRNLHATIRNLHPSQRLPLIDMAIPALSRMSQPQYDEFMGIVTSVIRSDGQVSLFEWCIHTTLERHLGERFQADSKHPPRNRRLSKSIDDANLVLAIVARLGSDDAGSAMPGWKAGIERLGSSNLRMPEESQCSLRNLRTALNRLQRIRFQDRRVLLEACEATIDHDGKTTIEEAELLRAIADSLGCPMPPVIPDAA